MPSVTRFVLTLSFIFMSDAITVLKHKSHSREEYTCNAAFNVTGAEEILIEKDSFLNATGAALVYGCQCQWRLRSTSLHHPHGDYRVEVCLGDVPLDEVRSPDWAVPSEAFSFIVTQSKDNLTAVSVILNGVSEEHIISPLFSPIPQDVFFREEPHSFDKESFTLVCRPEEWLAVRVENGYKRLNSGDRSLYAKVSDEDLIDGHSQTIVLVPVALVVILVLMLVAFVTYKCVSRLTNNHPSGHYKRTRSIRDQEEL